MFRISAYVAKSSPLGLNLRRVTPATVKIQAALLSRSPIPQQEYKNAQERRTCPPPPPPPLKPYKFNFYLISSGILLAFTGSFIVYAKSNPEVRDWLSINAPWFDEIVAAVYQENKPLSKSVAGYLAYFRDVIDDYFKEVPEDCYGKPTPLNIGDKNVGHPDGKRAP